MGRVPSGWMGAAPPKGVVMSEPVSHYPEGIAPSLRGRPHSSLSRPRPGFRLVDQATDPGRHLVEGAAAAPPVVGRPPPTLFAVHAVGVHEVEALDSHERCVWMLAVHGASLPGKDAFLGAGLMEGHLLFLAFL